MSGIFSPFSPAYFALICVKVDRDQIISSSHPLVNYSTWKSVKHRVNRHRREGQFVLLVLASLMNAVKKKIRLSLGTLRYSPTLVISLPTPPPNLSLCLFLNIQLLGISFATGDHFSARERVGPSLSRGIGFRVDAMETGRHRSSCKHCCTTHSPSGHYPLFSPSIRDSTH